MKQLLFAILIFGLYACNDSKGEKPKQVQRDTTKTVAIYEFGNTRQLRIDEVFKIVKDTFAVDSVKAKLTWKKDTTFYIPVVDTVRKEGVIEKDSVGKPKLFVTYYPLPPDYIHIESGKPLRSQ